MSYGFEGHQTRLARRKLGLGDEWESFRWRVMEDKTTIRIHLGVPVPMKKDKSRARWPKPWKIAYFSAPELDEERARYERETGNCYRCEGKGARCVGCGVVGGGRWVKCPRCNLTGNAPPSAV